MSCFCVMFFYISGRYRELFYSHVFLMHNDASYFYIMLIPHLRKSVYSISYILLIYGADSMILYLLAGLAIGSHFGLI